MSRLNMYIHGLEVGVHVGDGGGCGRDKAGGLRTVGQGSTRRHPIRERRRDQKAISILVGLRERSLMVCMPSSHRDGPHHLWLSMAGLLFSTALLLTVVRAQVCLSVKGCGQKALY